MINNQNLKKIESVQMLRGIAALSVVFSHLTLGRGRFGVDLFFCISGFIMMLVTEKSYKDFLKKRILRICPIYYFLTTMAILTALVAPNLLRTPTSDLSLTIRSFLFIGGEDPIVGVGWTLNFEMFFYFLFFLSFSISHKYRHLIATGFLTLLVLSGLSIKSDNPYFRFYTNPIILEFALGMFAYIILAKKNLKPSRTMFPLAALIYISLFFYDLPFHRLIAFGLPAFISFVLTVKSLQNHDIPKPLILIGNISYSLYLTHTFIISITSTILFGQRTIPNSLIGIAGSFAILGIVICVAYVSWYFIEEKFSSYLKTKLLL